MKPYDNIYAVLNLDLSDLDNLVYSNLDWVKLRRPRASRDGKPRVLYLVVKDLILHAVPDSCVSLLIALCLFPEWIIEYCRDSLCRILSVSNGVRT